MTSRLTATDMVALVVRGPAEHGLECLPMPVPAPHEALVRVEHVALCGTDLRLLRGTLHDADYPVIPGHEWSGRVAASAARPELVGHRVVGHNFLPCGRCDWCATGRHNLCPTLDEIGFSLPGAFAEALVVPADNLRLLPAGVSGAEACLLEPLGVALHAMERAGSISGCAVGIVGAGTVGLLAGQLVRAAGAKRVSIAEPLASRRAVATTLRFDDVVTGIDAWVADPPEVIFDATGSADVFAAAVPLTRQGGRYVLVGYSGAEVTTFAPATVMLREITVIGVLSGYGQLDAAIAAVTSGAVELGPLVSAPLPMTSYASALESSGEDATLRRFFVVPERTSV